MAETNANININADTSQALAAIKNLQRSLSQLYTNMAKGSAAAQASVAGYQQNLVNSINATGQFTARLTTVKTTTEAFTTALEKNKLSLGQYFKYGTASTKRFGKVFTSEFNTIEKVARERVKDLQTQYIKMGRDANGAMKAIAVRPTTLDMTNLGTQTAIAAQKQQIFNQLIKQGSTNLLNWGKNTQWAGRQLMVGFTIPLAIFATQAGKSFMQLEQQAIKFKRVYGDLFTTGAQTEQALSDMRELATEFTKFGVAVEETIGLASTVAQMGKTGADLTAQVTEATRLSVLGGMSQEEALNTTIGLTNAFGISVEDLTNKVNFLNAAENQTILSIDDFNEAVPRAGSVVAQLGGSVEDLAFFLTAMREGGINAAQGANALKSSLGRLINPTQRAKDALRGYGIDVTGIVERNTGNLRGTILELANALDTLEPLEKARAIETLFGKFQFARMSTLFQNVVKDGSQAATVLELINSSSSDLATIAGRELGRVEESAATKFTAALERFQAALAPIGEEFLRLATPVIEWVTNLLQRFNDLGDGGKKFIVLLAAAIGAVAPVLLMVIGLTANLIANFIKGIATINQFMQRFRNGSQNLAEQTSYMNSEQIESSAIAASLDQVHQTLSQTFTVEASALGKLTAAYERANNAARQFRGPIVTDGGKTMKAKGLSKGRKVPGYAEGVVSVPGSGNKDTEPAMLTPGEAVIPAKMAKKYAPLINAMISGNIPGFAGGKGVAGFVSGVAGQGRSGRSQAAIEAFLYKELDRLGTASKEVQQEFKEFITGVANGSENLTKTVLEKALKANKQLMAKYPKEAGNFAHVGGRVDVAASQVSSIPNITLTPAVQQQIEVLSRHVPDQVIRLYHGMGQTITGSLQAAMSKQGAGIKALTSDIASRGIESFRSSVQLAGGSLGELAPGLKQLQNNIKIGLQKASKAGAQFVVDTQEDLQRIKQAQGDAFDPKLYVVFEEIQREALEGVTEMQDELRQIFEIAGNTLTELRYDLTNESIAILQQSEEGRALLAGLGTTSEGTQRRNQRAGVSGDFESVRQSTAKREETVATKQQTVAEQSQTQATKESTKSTARSAAATKNFSGKVMGVTFGLSGLIGTMSMFDGVIGDTASKMFPFVSAITGATMALQLLEGTAFSNAFLGRFKVFQLGLIRAAVSVKKVSGIFTKLFTAIRIGFSAFTKFLGIPGLVISGLVALGGIAWKVYQQHVEYQKSLQGLSSVVDMTSEKMAGLAELVGASRTGSVFEQDIKVGSAGMDAQQFAAGESAINQAGGLEEFKEQYEDEINAITRATGDNAVSALQALIVRMFGEGFTADQVKEAVAALGIASGKLDIFEGIDVEALNPFGEDGGFDVNAIRQSGQQAANEFAGAFGEQQRLALAASQISTYKDAFMPSAENMDAIMAPLNEIGAATSNSIKAVSSAFSRGAIDADQFENGVDAALSGLRGIADQETQMLAVQNAAEKLFKDSGEDMQEFAKNIKDMEDLEILSKGLTLGLEVDPEYADTIAQANVELEKNGTVSEKTQTKLNTMRREQIGLINEATAARAQELEVTKLQTAQQEIQNMQIANAELADQIQAYYDLVDAGVDAAVAYKIVGDAALYATYQQLGAAGAANTASTDFVDFINTVKEGLALEKEFAGFSPSSSGASVVDTSSFDSITSSLRNFADAQVSVTQGFDDTISEVQKFMSVSNRLGGSFNGLNKQLNSLGLNENLIEMIVGMDPDEYEKRKNDLFVFDDQGSIVGMTSKLQSLNDALNMATIGEFINEQNNITVSVGNQITALSRLTSAGASYEAAYRAVQNTALAAAIATAKSSAEIQAAAEAAMQAQEMMDKFEEIDEEEQRKNRISDAVKEQNKQFSNQAKIINYINKNRSKLSEAQIESILSDKDLQALVLEPSINPKALQTALDNANKQAELELKIKKLTTSGQEEIFEEGFGKAMESFNVQENKIELEFEAKMSKDQSIIDVAEQDIAKLEFMLDDYEAGLEEIDQQEQVINDAYDKRYEALDKIAEANERITQQQQSQLDIADALSRGDIAAAARAIQEARAAAAEASVEDERARLERAQASQVAGLTSRGGLTRDELDDRVRGIQEQIFRIEEDRLEPAQEAMRLAEIQKEADIEALEVLGKTKKEWEAISQRIDEARINNYKFVDAIKEGLDIVEKLIDSLNGGRPISIQPVPSSGGGGRSSSSSKKSSPAPAPAPAPDPRPRDPDPDPRPAPKPDVRVSTKNGKTIVSVTPPPVRGEPPNRTKTTTYSAEPPNRTKTYSSGPPNQTKTPQKYIYIGGTRIPISSGGLVPKYSMGGFVRKAMSGPRQQFAMGGLVSNYLSTMANGGQYMGSDSIPALLTPGEFVIRRPAVQGLGVKNLEKLNRGENVSGSVYNYNLNVNVRSESDPNQIARSVMSSIRQIENKRIRDSRF